MEWRNRYGRKIFNITVPIIAVNTFIIVILPPANFDASPNKKKASRILRNSTQIIVFVK